MKSHEMMPSNKYYYHTTVNDLTHAILLKTYSGDDVCRGRYM